MSLRGKWKLRGGAAVEGPLAAAAAALVTARRSLRGSPSAAMPMKGRFPIRRTLQYLGQGDVVFKDTVKVMTVNYNTHGKLGEGARSVRAREGVPRGWNNVLVTGRPGTALSSGSGPRGWCCGPM